MAMKELVERECGGDNAVMHFASHFTQDSSAHPRLVAEFSGDGRHLLAPSTFHMGGLLQELKNIEGAQLLPKLGPDAMDPAALSWADQFLSDPMPPPPLEGLSAPPQFTSGKVSSNWMKEYLEPVPRHPGGPDARSTELWASEYLDLSGDRNAPTDEAEFERIFERMKESSSTEQPPNTSLVDVANDLLKEVETADPKLANSEFMKFVRQIGEGSLSLDPDNPELAPSSNAWASEFTTSPPVPSSVVGSAAWAQEPVEPGDVTAPARERTRQFYDIYPRGVRADEWVPEYGEGLAEAAELTEWYNDVPHEAMAEKWAEEFAAESSNASFWENLQKQWEELAENDVEGVHSWLTDYNKLDVSNYYKEYKFDESNPLLQEPALFEQGLRRLEEGDIPSAVLLFEAAVQSNPLHTEAWQYLGTTQASNEQDHLAIAALRKCVEQAGDNLTALLSLAVSYTNESMQQQACDTLVAWLRHNPKYSRVVSGPPQGHSLEGAAGGGATAQGRVPTVSSFVSSSQYNEVRDLFLRAVQSEPRVVDPDAQVGLGVLYNLAGDYDKAVDCFSAALQIRPGAVGVNPSGRSRVSQDSLIWNKLGASLANGRRSEEAVEAYRRALALSPGYTRTRYNLGIACVNLGAYREALEHFLTALTSQHSSLTRSSPSAAPLPPQPAQGDPTAPLPPSQSTMSDSIWASVKTTLLLLRRADLIPACEQHLLEQLNKEFNSSA